MEFLTGQRTLTGKILALREFCDAHVPTSSKRDLHCIGARVWVGKKHISDTPVNLFDVGIREGRSTRRVLSEQRFNGQIVVSAKGLPWKVKLGAVKSRFFGKARLPSVLEVTDETT